MAEKAYSAKPILAKTCAQCGVVYVPKRNYPTGRYCSKRCREKFDTQQGKRFRVNRKILYYKDCAYCGKEFGVIAADRATCCSRECGLQYAAQNRKITRVVTSAPRIKRISYAQCKECKKLYVVRHARNVFCSLVCHKTYALREYYGRSRFAEDKREPYERRSIWERDKFTCYLCKRVLDPMDTWPHPYSLTIDHVVPRARGGHDTSDNVRTACLQCNLRKRDAFPFDARGQLRFIA